ncbi:hypothetical protein FDI85_gp260 [Erwinia phage Machina]|uniref:Uncharacterized protein n=2 Tax=Machinavirus machina TaxID=2169990 RepID=A0A1B2ICV3_9CAUD|nr:hypothetical protein BIZ81_gp258 [Erwinia phage vB_EamM_Huxley]YP_009616941.1 hypothetical protein FDI85_gp260 [Erwinia phage Machina]ANZ49107.1 hypothetical protein HUXLEY_25 [Erwinia phage vB_EamM_Huxley]ANZ49662.1 hypothetical protein MACHINA_24 [Erwinia phage Machina]ANZ49935.1 hypothetical protein PARSHIK_26 [Erwinia phage vB_EamM_Parshik]
MTRVFFELNLKTKRGYIGPHWIIINAIQELIYPGTFNLEKRLLERAEEYFGTDAWYMIAKLGPNHRHPFIYHNGVVETWSSYTSNQLMCM